MTLAAGFCHFLHRSQQCIFVTFTADLIGFVTFMADLGGRFWSRRLICVCLSTGDLCGWFQWVRMRMCVCMCPCVCVCIYPRPNFAAWGWLRLIFVVDFRGWYPVFARLNVADFGSRINRQTDTDTCTALYICSSQTNGERVSACALLVLYGTATCSLRLCPVRTTGWKNTTILPAPVHLGELTFGPRLKQKNAYDKLQTLSPKIECLEREYWEFLRHLTTALFIVFTWACFRSVHLMSY